MAEPIRVLLDESIPEQLRLAFSASFDVRTVRYQGWSGLKNGTLLRVAEVDFDILVTVDKGLRHQQNIGERDIAVVVFHATGTTYADLLPLIEKAEKAFLQVEPGSVLIITT